MNSEKTCPVLLCPPQIPHWLIWARTRAYAVRDQRLTAWVMARRSRVINPPNIPRGTWVKITRAARKLTMLVAKKPWSCEHDIFRSRTCVLSRTFIHFAGTIFSQISAMIVLVFLQHFDASTSCIPTFCYQSLCSVLLPCQDTHF
jgi:hypothetical protein